MVQWLITVLAKPIQLDEIKFQGCVHHYYILSNIIVTASFVWFCVVYLFVGEWDCHILIIKRQIHNLLHLRTVMLSLVILLYITVQTPKMIKKTIIIILNDWYIYLYHSFVLRNFIIRYIFQYTLLALNLTKKL